MRSDPILSPVKSPVSQAIIMICEKCGQKLLATAPAGAPNPATEFQRNMKTEIKNRFGKGVVRAVSSSCLDICPEGRVAVGIANNGAPPEFLTVAPADLPAAQEELLGRFNK